jgi:hypothetical protein
VRRSLLSLAILLALPCAAHAEQAAVALPEMKPPVEAEAPADAGLVLDLDFDPAVAPVEHASPFMRHARSAPQTHDDPGSFSLGLKIKPPREPGSPASRATAEEPGPPTLADKLEGLVERSAIGVTGTYHF